MKVKAKVRDLKGNDAGEVALPEAFSEPVRVELIRRAVVAAQANRLQPYGPNPRAGLDHAVKGWGVGRGVSRVPRLTISRRAAVAVQAVGGRRAFPPVPERVWAEKVNRKERRLAIRSAVAATALTEMVRGRGHRFEGTLPLVVVDDIQGLKKTADVVETLLALGLKEEMARTAERKIRAGKGTRRGRKYRRPVGPLIVVGEDQGISMGGRNIPGLDVVTADQLCAEDLAPGTQPGRLVVWSASAIRRIGEVLK